MQQRARQSQSLSDRRFEIPGPRQINPAQMNIDINRNRIPPQNPTPTGFCPNCPCHNCLAIKNQTRQKQPQGPLPSPTQYQEPIGNGGMNMGMGFGMSNGMNSGINNSGINNTGIGISQMELQQQQRKNDYMLGYQTEYRSGNGAMTPIDFSSGQMSRDKFNGDYFKRESYNTDHFAETVNLMGHNNHVRYERPEMNTKQKMKSNSDMRMSGGKTIGAPGDMLN